MAIMFSGNEWVYTLTFPGLRRIKRLTLRCICCEWVNLITFDIFLVGKGPNE